MIYFIRESSDGSIKIGFSGNPVSRIKNLQISTAKELILLGVMCGEKEEEKALHRKFSKINIRGEWFYPTGELIDYIDSNCIKLPAKDKDKPERHISNFISMPSAGWLELKYFPKRNGSGQNGPYIYHYKWSKEKRRKVFVKYLGKLPPDIQLTLGLV